MKNYVRTFSSRLGLTLTYHTAQRIGAGWVDAYSSGGQNKHGDVVTLQQRLYALGYLTYDPKSSHPVDGNFGGGTQSAVQAFQVQYMNMNTSSAQYGNVDTETWEKIYQKWFEKFGCIEGEAFISPVEMSVSGKITSTFNENDSAHVDHVHRGTDIGGVIDQEVYAIRSGLVLKSGWNDARGNYAYIDHYYGVRAVYQHLKGTPFVTAGDTVTQGQKLGIVGNSGRSFGAHLHIELLLNVPENEYRNSIPYDDMQYHVDAAKYLPLGR